MKRRAIALAALLACGAAQAQTDAALFVDRKSVV